MKPIATILLSGLAVASAWATDYSGCFIPGEVSTYKIYWMGIPIAWSSTTTDKIEEDGRELIRIRMVAQTYKAYNYLYEVDDVTEIIIDPATALPVRLDFTLNEGTVHKSHLTTFYHDNKVAVFQDRISKDIREIPIEADTQEIYSFIYSNRKTDLKTLAGESRKLLVEGKLYSLGIKILDDDNVKLPDYGKVPSVEIEPIAEFDGIFLRQGKIFFWISKQQTRVVTCIKAKVAVGNITAKLHEMSGPINGFWNKDG